MQVHYLEEPAPDYVRAAVTAAAELHATGLPGDILIFLTGAPKMTGALGLFAALSCQFLRKMGLLGACHVSLTSATLL